MRNKGFTLIELIIVISIVLALASVAIPGILSFQEFQNEEQFVNQVINSLRNYQNLALTRDSYTKVTTQKSYVQLCENTDCQDFQYSKDVFLSNNQEFYFGRFGNAMKNQSQNIDNNIVLETNFFRITINKNGGIFKDKK